VSHPVSPFHDSLCIKVGSRRTNFGQQATAGTSRSRDEPERLARTPDYLTTKRCADRTHKPVRGVLTRLRAESAHPGWGHRHRPILVPFAAGRLRTGADLFRHCLKDRVSVRTANARKPGRSLAPSP